jgi:hypothetical protein
MGGWPTPNPHKEYQTHVRKTSGMSVIQPPELQGVLQSQTLRIRQEGQGLPEEEKAKAKTKKE